MKNRLLVPLLAVMAVVFWSCGSSDSTEPLPGEGAISGTVVDASSGSALQGVSITIHGVSGDSPTTQTDDQGKFDVKFSVDSVITVTIDMARDRYRDTTFALKVLAGSTTALTVKMTSVQAVSGGSGLPQTIAFLSAVPQELSVYGVGGKETAVLNWEVRDSLGNPVDDQHPASISFSIVGQLGGGEYLSPSVLTTDASGRAAITFNSGTRAGVIQVVASTTVGTKSVSSSPVRVVIHGGFPDQAHFTIASPTFNFPALGIAGLRHQVSVLVGDKYSNPAAPSAVYFRSSAGVIQGTVGQAITTVDGEGTVDLISGNPAPYGSYSAPAFGDGYHYVVAQTLGQNGAVVQDSILLVWSGGALITGIAPTTFNIPNAGSQVITFRVEDVLGHPLASGTAIDVVATIPPPPTDGAYQNKAFLTFGTDGRLVLPDLLFPGPGHTSFTMTVQDGSWGIVDSAGTPTNVTITVTGPNTANPIAVTISGVIH
ncbi:MAG: carboxypeptidase regulatory-like domain-containing protein [Bacteroidota bacterium]